jgi:hypothetical protein
VDRRKEEALRFTLGMGSGEQRFRKTIALSGNLKDFTY